MKAEPASVESAAVDDDGGWKALTAECLACAAGVTPYEYITIAFEAGDAAPGVGVLSTATAVRFADFTRRVVSPSTVTWYRPLDASNDAATPVLPLRS